MFCRAWVLELANACTVTSISSADLCPSTEHDVFIGGANRAWFLAGAMGEYRQQERHERLPVRGLSLLKAQWLNPSHR